MPSREETETLVKQAAGPIPVIFSNNPTRDGDVIEREIIKQGASPDVARQQRANAQVEFALTFPKQNQGACVAVIREVTPESAPSLPALIREIATFDKQGAEARKFIALHEGAHCVMGEVLGKMGLSLAENSGDSPFTKWARTVASEGYPEGVAALLYLRDAYRTNDPKRIAESRELIETVRQWRQGQSQNYELARLLLGTALNTSPSVISGMSDNQIRSTVSDTVQLRLKEALTNSSWPGAKRGKP